MGVLFLGFAMGLMAATFVALAGGAIWVAALAYVFVGLVSIPLVGVCALLAWPKRALPGPTHDAVQPATP